MSWILMEQSLIYVNTYLPFAPLFLTRPEPRAWHTGVLERVACVELSSCHVLGNDRPS